MLICYYLGAILMISDGTTANPLTALNDLHIQDGYLEAYNKGGPVWYKLNPNEAQDPVDLVLLTCDQRAHDPVQHP
jgi:hypothetical protein